MNSDEIIRLETAREYKISKANQLIQKSRFNLSLQEQRAIAYICSMIKPRTALANATKQPFQLEYEFEIADFIRICGLESSGVHYDNIKDTLKSLRDKSMWLEMEDGSEVLVAWLAKARTNKKSGKAKIKLDEDLVPYLFNLQEKFTSYELLNVLAFTSQYSYRIYEIMLSYDGLREKTFSLDDFKRRLMVEDIKSYANFKDFRKKVLEPAIKEINAYTDIALSYDTVTRGRKVVKLVFYIQKKVNSDIYDSHFVVYDRIGEIHNKKQ